MTISSFNSVSLDPPLVLWSIAENSYSYDAFVKHEGLHGLPILPEFAACFECRTEHLYEGGDHKIVVGRVLRLEDRETDPLIFYRGHYLNNCEPKPQDQ
jgi:3-hydroxy-9,10-secoandrosta-1,3,5(10)-triene-9,17-dione monooxygenase reductase component